MRVKDLPVTDRPRERLLDLGSEALSDRELLALLLGSGARDLDAIELAGQLIASQGGLRRLAHATPHELVGLVLATADIAECALPLLRGLRHERVVVVVCDAAGTVIRTVRLTDGATDRSLIPVRDVLSVVLASGGVSFGVAHNHPAGNPAPSTSDRNVTARLAEAAKAVGLCFLDHVVVTDNEWRRVTTDP